MKKANHFWVSYADLMTSLFFVMLVLYIVTFTVLKDEIKLNSNNSGLVAQLKGKVLKLSNKVNNLENENGKLVVAATKLKDIENIEKALETLDKDYFEFDKVNKRYKLTTDVSFNSGSDNIDDISIDKRKELKEAGEALYYKIFNIIDNNPNVDYLLVIEGNTQIVNGNNLTIPNEGYKLSYRRALALFNFWKENEIDFRDLGEQCEIILAGSGYFGYSRDMYVEENNRRFTIQITSKVGKLIN